MVREPNTYKLRDISGLLGVCIALSLPRLHIVVFRCVREMMPPKLEVNTQCVVRVCMCVRAIICVSRRDNVWVHVQLGIEQQQPKMMMKGRKKGKSST